MPDRRKVVITGLGAVTPLGLGATTLHDRWAAGVVGITDGAARCTDFDVTEHLSVKEARRLDRFAQLAVVAAGEALAHAGWADEAPYDPTRVGCVIATGIGGQATLEAQLEVMRQRGARMVSPLGIPMYMPNAAAAAVTMRYKLRGQSYAVVSACASGAHAIGSALRMIQYGEADAVVCGGAESALTDFSFACFNSMEALSPDGISRPFDARRNGFVMGEGSGMLVLEDAESARERGATILGEVAGYGSTTDAHHLTAPEPSGGPASRAIELALRDAGAEPAQIDYINAHGTSTQLNDAAETRALKTALGAEAKRIPISSTKSSIGHTLGAAGAVEAVATIRTFITGVIAPTLGYEVPDPELDLDYVPGEARPLVTGNGHPPLALSNSFAFGGHNVALALRGAAK
ncbi:MAG TPA: beta-ketoacyl-[acyl-carrier-protein] synthase family protein [Solirubrobacteraceae bacterium]|jgi:3-oxoacyl-[acyl-carrier-protein] synthase II|nr:beta-ketoacyl-[acyl-carrier-protein] synthase family protein [Solirubrobacteraceae bacterium]